MHGGYGACHRARCIVRHKRTVSRAGHRGGHWSTGRALCGLEASSICLDSRHHKPSGECWGEEEGWHYLPPTKAASMSARRQQTHAPLSLCCFPPFFLPDAKHLLVIGVVAMARPTCTSLRLVHEGARLAAHMVTTSAAVLTNMAR